MHHHCLNQSTHRYLGAFEEYEILCAESLYFFKSTNREMPEFIANAYRHGSFGKVHEFEEFQERIRTSLQSAIVSCEAEHLLMLKDCDTKYVTFTLCMCIFPCRTKVEDLYGHVCMTSAHKVSPPISVYSHALVDTFPSRWRMLLHKTFSKTCLTTATRMSWTHGIRLISRTTTGSARRDAWHQVRGYGGEWNSCEDCVLLPNR